MTQEEIEKRLTYLLNQIDTLQQNNISIKNKIFDLVEGSEKASSTLSNWETALSNCYSSVKTSLLNTNQNSGFKSYYLEKINLILSSKEANEISECIAAVNSNAMKKINDYENTIDNNDKLIFLYQKEVNELKSLQTLGDGEYE